MMCSRFPGDTADDLFRIPCALKLGTAALQWRTICEEPWSVFQLDNDPKHAFTWLFDREHWWTAVLDKHPTEAARGELQREEDAKTFVEKKLFKENFFKQKTRLHCKCIYWNTSIGRTFIIGWSLIFVSHTFCHFCITNPPMLGFPLWVTWLGRIWRQARLKSFLSEKQKSFEFQFSSKSRRC